MPGATPGKPVAWAYRVGGVGANAGGLAAAGGPQGNLQVDSELQNVMGHVVVSQRTNWQPGRQAPCYSAASSQAPFVGPPARRRQSWSQRACTGCMVRGALRQEESAVGRRLADARLFAEIEPR